jgi:CheY-like chemotaxis protein
LYTQSSILVVDDNEFSRDMLSQRLGHEGYTVAVAEHGREALQKMEVERFDLVLLDLLMPVMDGYTVLERIMTTPALRDTPVIVVTALNEKDSVFRCLQLGAKDYVVKPFEMVTVKTRIWRCLENGRTPKGRRVELSENDLSGARILIVDDEQLNRDLLFTRMRHTGYAPPVAENGRDALEYLRAQEFDLILLDIMMPEIDGFQLLSQIKADSRINQIPVMMVSALDDTDTIARCFDMGATDYVTKPFNAIELKARVLSCLNLKKQQDQESACRARLEELSAAGRTLGRTPTCE